MVLVLNLIDVRGCAMSGAMQFYFLFWGPFSNLIFGNEPMCIGGQ